MINEERIDINPDICHGKPRIKGTRIMISLILEWLEAGKSFEEIKESHLSCPPFYAGRLAPISQRFRTTAPAFAKFAPMNLGAGPDGPQPRMP